MTRIAVLGAGAWGTAIACALSSRGPVSLWARNSTLAQTLSVSRHNQRYLPGIVLPISVEVTAELSTAVTGADLLLAATPVAGLRDLLARIPPAMPVVWLCKGLDRKSVV